MKVLVPSVGMCLDITFAVSSLAQFSENPGQVYWDMIKHIFYYLNGMKELVLTCGGNGKNQGLNGFSDADGASQEHQHAITSYAFLVNGGAVSWISKKQELVMLSTIEAKYVASSQASREAMWLCMLIGKIFHPLKQPTPLYCDNPLCH
jgi:hypothetical protein